jgi:hypothetical protein
LITPLLSPNSYRGVSFELFPNLEVFKGQSPHTDQIYSMLYNKTFAEVGKILHEEVKARQKAESDYKSIKDSIKIADLNKISNIMTNIPKSLLSSYINNVENCIDENNKHFAKYMEIDRHLPLRANDGGRRLSAS